MTLCLETSRWGSVGTQVKKNFIVAMLQGEISRGRGSQVDFFFFFACVMMSEQENETTVVGTLAVTHSLWSPSLTSVSPS